MQAPLSAPAEPVDLPQDVGERAPGEAAVAMAPAEAPATPEPAAWAGSAMVLAVLAMLARRRRRQNAARFTA
ncbi:MAG TPA: PEP-CTERM sorting domain-containing protein [Ramlibacter sp.]|nr:PEP-CTERM sorting domain-containing protein [Ramlibacter sp.]